MNEKIVNDLIGEFKFAPFNYRLFIVHYFFFRVCLFWLRIYFTDIVIKDNYWQCEPCVRICLYDS